MVESTTNTIVQSVLATPEIDNDWKVSSENSGQDCIQENSKYISCFPAVSFCDPNDKADEKSPVPRYMPRSLV